MEINEKKIPRKSKVPTSSIVMYVGAIIVALVAIASLINNIILFKTSIADYVTQGYKNPEILNHLIPGQLLPAIFETVAVYCGIAFILLSAGIINHKVTKYIELLSASKNNDIFEKSILDIENVDNKQNQVYDEINELIKVTDNN